MVSAYNHSDCWFLPRDARSAVCKARYCYRKSSVRPSVTLLYPGHIGGTSSKLITRVILLAYGLRSSEPQHRQSSLNGTPLKFGWNRSGVALPGLLTRPMPDGTRSRSRPRPSVPRPKPRPMPGFLASRPTAEQWRRSRGDRGDRSPTCKSGRDNPPPTLQAKLRAKITLHGR